MTVFFKAVNIFSVQGGPGGCVFLTPRNLTLALTAGHDVTIARRQSQVGGGPSEPQGIRSTPSGESIVLLRCHLQITFVTF